MTSKEEKQMQKSTKYLTEVETLAQEILIAKHQKLELSNARNKYTEALRALQQSDERRTIIQTNNICSMEFPKNIAMQILKDDIDSSSKDIDKLYDEIKIKVSKFRDLEHEPKIEGISLKPLTGAEAKAIQKSLGYSEGFS